MNTLTFWDTNFENGSVVPKNCHVKFIFLRGRGASLLLGILNSVNKSGDQDGFHFAGSSTLRI